MMSSKIAAGAAPAVLALLTVLTGCTAKTGVESGSAPGGETGNEAAIAPQDSTQASGVEESDTPPGETSAAASADGSAIFYETRGAGDTAIVFVHCWTCNAEFWQPQLDYFSSDYQVIALDLAGHGQSRGSQRQDYTMAAFGQDVAAVVNQATDADKVVLVGHSMGGPVSVEAAKVLGDRVAGIVGVDTFYTGFDYPDSEAAIDGFIQPFKEDFLATSEQLVRSMFTPNADPALVDGIVAQMADADQAMAVSAMYDIFRWNGEQAPTDLQQYADQLRNINGAPTGTESALHESVTLIPGVGHFVAQAKPDEFNQTLAQILTEFQSP